ncbi:hypothetical protein MY04_0683 [Flammeovirga sp. MY04]|uniref:hypothetical protein n=1 Tax=Flammeovirga sp. MY04 TaxID=1191459 RepID=UPI0008060C9F|nr:hypothetical protein [Flammeovirga sp. MY04]ANQ48065.1 hypothetical protein MY04_0683 [Flammeovirga sp. MY04]
MIKINYPVNKEFFEDSYYSLIKEKFSHIEKKVNLILDDNVQYQNERLTFKTLLLQDFENISNLQHTIEEQLNVSQLNKLIKVFKTEASPTKYLYDNAQDIISSYFTDISKLKIDSCFYCNIDYVNPFSDFSYYNNALDFLNNATEKELKKARGIGKVYINYILNRNFKSLKHFRPRHKDGKLPSKNIKLLIKNLRYDIKRGRNTNEQYTLDHVLPKVKFPIFSLSLYNFVPSCYICNTKLKLQQYDKENYFINTSPSSKLFSLNENYKFTLDVTKNLKIKLRGEIITKDESMINEINNYLEIFNIRSRYQYHDDKAKELFNKCQKYTPSNIKNIAKLTKSTESDVKCDIFGSELNDQNRIKPFSKLKNDIAKHLKII